MVGTAGKQAQTSGFQH